MSTEERPPEQTELLVALVREEERSSTRPILVSRLAEMTGAAPLKCWKTLRDLRAQDLVETFDVEGRHTHVSGAELTDSGRKVARDLALVPAKGRVEEFAQDLTDLQLAVLDVVAEQKARNAGAAPTRSHVRSALRNGTWGAVPRNEINEAITVLHGTHLDAPGESCRLLPYGLLASGWGRNAVDILDGLFELLRDELRHNPGLPRYSWTMVRSGLGLPRHALDLFHVTVTRCGLGSGTFEDSQGETCWTVPDNLDEILDEPSAVDFLRKRVQTSVPAPKAETAVSGKDASLSNQQQTGIDPKKVFIIHGRNVAARNAVEQFVRVLGLEPLDFDQVSADLGGSPFVGDVVRRGLELAQGVAALFTPDEFAVLRPGLVGHGEKPEEAGRWQARPNVIFEAGMAWGMMARRTVLVTLGTEVSMFSDVGGVHLVRLGNDVKSRGLFRDKLIGIGCSVDQRTTAWSEPARSGDFEACIKGLPAMSPQNALVEAETAPVGFSALDIASARAFDRVINSDWMLEWYRSQESYPQYLKREELNVLVRYCREAEKPERRFQNNELRQSHKSLVSAVTSYINVSGVERVPKTGDADTYVISTKDSSGYVEDYAQKYQRQIAAILAATDSVWVAWEQYSPLATVALLTER